MKKWPFVVGGISLLALGAAFAYSRLSPGIEVDVYGAKTGAIEEYVTSVSAGTVKAGAPDSTPSMSESCDRTAEARRPSTKRFRAIRKSQARQAAGSRSPRQDSKARSNVA